MKLKIMTHIDNVDINIHLYIRLIEFRHFNKSKIGMVDVNTTSSMAFIVLELSNHYSVIIQSMEMVYF